MDRLIPNSIVIAVGLSVIYLTNEVDSIAALARDNNNSNTVSASESPNNDTDPAIEDLELLVVDEEVSENIPLDEVLSLLLEQSNEMSQKINEVYTSKCITNSPPTWATSLLTNVQEMKANINMLLKHQNLTPIVLDGSTAVGSNNNTPHAINNSVGSTDNNTNIASATVPVIVVSYLQREELLIQSIYEYILHNMQHAVSLEHLKQATNSLVLYINKIIEVIQTNTSNSATDYQLLLSRYRKINTNNNIFIKNIKELVNKYELILENIGFATRMNKSNDAIQCFEYIWHKQASTVLDTKTSIPNNEDALQLLKMANVLLTMIITYSSSEALLIPHTDPVLDKCSKEIYQRLHPS